MPAIFIHGVSVRENSFSELSQRVHLALREHRSEAEMPYRHHFWGGDAAVLRWNGASIPGFTGQAEEEVATEARVSLPDLRLLLSVDPLAELRAYEQAIDPSRGFNPAVQQLADRNARLRLSEQELTDVLSAGLSRMQLDASFLRITVRQTLEAATRTEARLDLPQLNPLIGRSLAAAFHRHSLLPDQALGSPAAAERWDQLLEITHGSVDQVLGGQRAVGDLLRNSALSLATFALRRGLRGQLMPAITRFLGDVFVYLDNRERYLDSLYAAVIKSRNQSQTPLWLIGHSLGGIMAFDLCSRYSGLDVERLATVGSQVGLFAEVDLLHARHGAQPLKHGKRQAPNNVERWVSLYDDNDMLSFKAAPIFQKVEEHSVDTGEPFPDSHGAYWRNKQVYEYIFG